MDRKGACQLNVYRIKVKESLDRSIANLIGEISIEPQENGETLMIGAFLDQPALRGFLNQLLNLNYTILSVTRMEDENAD